MIVSKDAAAGVIVAYNAFSYTQSLINWTIRTTLTFEAKDGRFRIRHTSIERFTTPYGWNPVGKWTGSKWQGVETAIQNVTASLANCVRNPRQTDDW